MNILYIITSLRSGGAEHLAADLLSMLSERGHSVDLFIFDGSHTHLSEKLERKSVRIIRGGRGAWQMWNPLHLSRIRRIIKEGKYDIVHTHNAPPQILTAFAGVKEVVKLVTTEHNTSNRRRNSSLGRWLDRKVYAAYHHIVCVSDKTKENLLNHINIEEGKVSVISNGIDLKRFRNPSSTDTATHKSDDEKKVVLMVGAFRKQKDQPTLIKAMKYLPESFVLWLAGGWSHREDCEKLSYELGLSNRVVFLGERHDIPELLNRSDIVVLSSHYEGMPLTAIEYMASGKPFIATDVEGLRDIAKGAALLVSEGDEKAMAESIFQVANNQSLADSIVEKCLLRAREFDIQNTLNAHIDLYKSLCR